MAAVITETVYLTRDNTIDLRLSSDSVDVDLSAVTRVDLIERNCAWEVTSDASPGAITWSESGTYLVVVMALGDEPIPVGTHNCRVIVYDASNPNGIVWGEIKLVVKTACTVI